jgi:excisionase family DNA binding protein
MVLRRPKKPENVLLTIPDAARTLGLGVRVLRRTIKCGQVQAVSIGDRMRIPRAEIQRLTTGGKTLIAPHPKRRRCQLSGGAEGIALIRQGIDALVQIGSRAGTPRYITSLADAQLRAGAIGDALETVEQALNFNPEEAVWRPETLRIRGELRLKHGDLRLSEADFRDSIAMPRSADWAFDQPRIADADPGADRFAAVTETTEKLCAGYFAFKALGPTKVKGISEPINVYEVTGLGPLRSHFQLSARRGLTKFVGRGRELEQMKRALEQAMDGHGQVVAVMAEAGTGKSRLFYEFKATLPPVCKVLEAYSVSHGKASAWRVSRTRA